MDPSFKNFNIIEVKEFSCEDQSKIFFKYPVFKDWEVKSITKTAKDEYTIYLNWPSNIRFEIAPQIKLRLIEERKIPDFETISSVKTNPFEVCYELVYFPSHYVKDYDPKGNWDALHFYRTTSVNGALMILTFDAENHGFSKKVFADKVIETFWFD
ncbi:MAG: hypothetical protein ABIJ10_06785 [Candidatus Micrarchaeota archaeon]